MTEENIYDGYGKHCDLKKPYGGRESGYRRPGACRRRDGSHGQGGN